MFESSLMMSGIVANATGGVLVNGEFLNCKRIPRS